MGFENGVGWFPGHMKSAKEFLKSNSKQVDLIINLVDARAPMASSNFSILKLFVGRPVAFFLGKSDLADESATKIWVLHFRNKFGVFAGALDCRNQKKIRNIFDLACDWLQKTKKLKFGRNMVRAMVVGIANVGKSSLINSLVGSKKTRVENRPGVTRSTQWVFLSNGISLLDTPGVIPNSIENEDQAGFLQLIGAVKREEVDVESLAVDFLNGLKNFSGFSELTFKKFFNELDCNENGLNLLLKLAKSRCMVLKGGEPNLERAANFVVDSFQKGKFGRLTLELPQN